MLLKRLENKTKVIVSIIFIIGVLFVSFVYAETLVSDIGVEYDSEIEFLLQNQTEVPVIVSLIANITSNYSNSIKSPEYQLFVEYIQRQVDEFKSNFSLPPEDEFKFEKWSYSSPSFYGNITQKGFGKLINDQRIEEIIINEKTTFSASGKLTSNEGVEYTASIIESFEDKAWLHVSVSIKDTSGIIIEGTKEQRIGLIEQKNKFLRPITEDIFATLSKEEFSLVGQKFPRGFEGLIREKGFYKLLKDPRIEMIELVTGSASTALGENGALENITSSENVSGVEEKNKMKGIQERDLSFIWIIFGSILVIVLYTVIIKVAKEKNEK